MITKLVTSNESGCSFYQTCNECQSDPECGWCDDGSGTGLGKCLPGGNHGNYDVSDIEGNDVSHFGSLTSQILGKIFFFRFFYFHAPFLNNQMQFTWVCFSKGVSALNARRIDGSSRNVHHVSVTDTRRAPITLVYVNNHVLI